MAFTKLRRAFSFFQHAINNPGDPLPGAEIDRELDAQARRINEIAEALSKIQREDLRLGNGVVFFDNLSEEILNALWPGMDFDFDGDGDTTGGPGGGTTTSGSGALFFRQLYDTPNSFAGSAGKLVRVNQGETGLVFDEETTREITFDELTDVPGLAENGGKVLAANQAGDALEFIEIDLDHLLRDDTDNDYGFNTQSKQTMGVYHEVEVDLGEVAGSVTIDPSAGNSFTAIITGDCVWNFASLPQSGRIFSGTLRILQGTGQGHTWFPNRTVNWGYRLVEVEGTDAEGNPTVSTEIQPRPAPAIADNADLTLGFVLHSDGVVKIWAH